MGVFPEKCAGGDVEADEVGPAGDILEGDEWAASFIGHEGVEVENAVEFVELGGEIVEFVVSGSGL